MMATNTSRSSYDTLVNEASADTNYGSWNLITILGGPAGQVRYSYVYLPGIPPFGSTITSATLRIWLQGSNWSGGPHTITAKRIIYPWKESLLTWNRTVSGQATTTNSASAAVTGGTDGQLVEFDVSLMLADVAAGGAWYGVRLEVDTADGVPRRIYSSEASDPAKRPQLVVEWNRAPLAPVDMSPSGGRSVSIANPVLGWVFRDREGDGQSELQVQISTASTVDSTGAFTSFEFDSGWVPSEETQLDLAQPISRTASVTTTLSSTTITAATATFDAGDVGASITGTGIPAGTTITAVASATSATMSQAATASGTVTATITRSYAGLADGDTRYWIVRTRDTAGLTSPWSAVQSFRRDVKPTLTLSSPVDGGTVDETTPPIVTTMTGAQEAITYSLFEHPSGRHLWSSGYHAAESASGAAYSEAIPAGLLAKTGQQYKLHVWAYDTVDRESTPGDPTQIPAYATFTFVRSATPSPVTSLTVVDETPGVKITWNRAAGLGHPDFWCLMVDGVRVYDRLDPLDYTLGGDPIVYEMVWYGAKPNLEHAFEIEAVVDDAGVLKHSQSNATVTMTPDLTEIGGTWLVDADSGTFPSSALPRKVRIRGAEVPDLQVGESSAMFYPIGRPDPVYIVDSIRGLEGPVSGVIDATDPQGSDFIENFEWAKRRDNIGRRWRLIFGDINVPVQIGKMSNTHADTHVRRHQVSVEVSQIDEFEQ